jgi:hypothetical protein
MVVGTLLTWWALTHERVVSVELTNGLDAPISDVVVLIWMPINPKLKGDERSVPMHVVDRKAWDHFGPRETRRFSIPHRSAGVVEVHYRDEEGRPRKAFGGDGGLADGYHSKRAWVRITKNGFANGAEVEANLVTRVRVAVICLSSILGL